MNIIATFPPGATQLTVNGLHQWDYGRKLEIHAADLPAIVEVHFACVGMREAVVRTCAAVNGVAEAAIPDHCLEQETPITAWVYEVGGTSGATRKTITLIVTPRAKPQPGGTVPDPISDKYTEAVAAVNKQVEALKVGNVMVANALEAGHTPNADYAVEAANADNALYASEAGRATQADQDSAGNDIPKTYLKTENAAKFVYYDVNNEKAITLGDPVTLGECKRDLSRIAALTLQTKHGDDVFLYQGVRCCDIVGEDISKYCEFILTGGGTRTLFDLDGMAFINVKVRVYQNHINELFLLFDYAGGVWFDPTGSTTYQHIEALGDSITRCSILYT